MNAAVHLLSVGVLTYERPELLRSALLDLRLADLPEGWHQRITVVDNSEDEHARAQVNGMLDAHLLHALIRPAENVGIAAAWNLAYGALRAPQLWSGHGIPDAIALIQDDVQLEPGWFTACWDALQRWNDLALVSGYNSPLHPTVERRGELPLQLYVQAALPGVHLVARTSTWDRLFPIEVAEHHTGEDWWFCKYAPDAPRHAGRVCGVVPGLVQHVGRQSKWNPTPHPEYADPVAETLT